jgi:hypothetical protein
MSEIKGVEPEWTFRADTARDHAEISRLRAIIMEQQQSLDFRWEADMRAIKRWQAAGPGRELTWPDHADMVVWLLEGDAHLRAELSAAQQDVERMRTALTIIADWDRAPITGEWRESLLDIIRSICDCARNALQGTTGRAPRRQGTQGEG